MSKKALIFSPYLDTLGGGELYTIHFAKYLESQGYLVDLGWKDNTLAQLVKDRFDLDISTFRVLPCIYSLFTQSSWLFDKYQTTRQYDVVFFLSDGSLPFVFGRKNLIHFQVPFKHLHSSPINRVKLHNQIVICNSKFTKTIIDQQLKIESEVLYPPVEQKKATTKENLLLSVGRFTKSMQNKRQDILIESFKKLIDAGVKNWRLVLIGNTQEKRAPQMVKDLKSHIKGYPIVIETDISHQELATWYGKASLYWHAAGFGIDAFKFPEKVEHFGISTVEAMSAGAVPIVVSKGGLTEIVTHKETGFYFETIDELVDQTYQLISQPDKLANLRKQAQKRAKDFSINKFHHSIGQLI